MICYMKESDGAIIAEYNTITNNQIKAAQSDDNKGEPSNCWHPNVLASTTLLSSSVLSADIHVTVCRCNAGDTAMVSK